MSGQGIAGYSTREVSEVLGLPTSTILAWARGGLLSPRRDGHGAYVFSFQDVAVLRSARSLLEAEVPPRRVRQTLEALRDQLPPGRTLSAVSLSAVGRRVLVRDGADAWEPDTGQLEMTLETPGAGRVGVVHRVAPPESGTPAAGDGADDWFEAGLELEGLDTREAQAHYRRALEEDPSHPDAHLNLGRLLHEEGRHALAEGHYRASLASDPANARAAFNLGVVLEDQGRAHEAEGAYGRALGLDPELAAAHFNLSRLHELSGRTAEALAHLVSYKRILDRG